MACHEFRSAMGGGCLPDPSDYVLDLLYRGYRCHRRRASQAGNSRVSELGCIAFGVSWLGR